MGATVKKLTALGVKRKGLFTRVGTPPVILHGYPEMLSVSLTAKYTCSGTNNNRAIIDQTDPNQYHDHGMVLAQTSTGILKYRVQCSGLPNEEQVRPRLAVCCVLDRELSMASL